MCTTRLHRALRITDLLQHASAILQALSEQVLLLRDLCQQHTEFVADIAQSLVVGALSPLTQLSGNRSALLGSVLVCADSMVLGLDEPVKALRQLRLTRAAQRGKGEMRFAARGAATGVATLGAADGVGAANVPVFMSEGVCGLG